MHRKKRQRKHRRLQEAGDKIALGRIKENKTKAEQHFGFE